MNKNRTRFSTAIIVVLIALVAASMAQAATFNLFGLALSDYDDTSEKFSITPQSVMAGESITVQAADTVVYSTAYYSINGGAWNSFSLQGNGGSLGDWLYSSASGSFSVPTNAPAGTDNHVIIYSCTFIGTSWSCSGDAWKLESFTVEAAPSTCNDNGVCDASETCGTCPFDCGVCDVPPPPGSG